MTTPRNVDMVCSRLSRDDLAFWKGYIALRTNCNNEMLAFELDEQSFEYKKLILRENNVR